MTESGDELSARREDESGREIDASLVRLRHHHRLLNVLALLVLAVSIAIAWNLVTG